MYPPELETLDQLCGGPMPLAVIRQLFGEDDRFRRAILAMLGDRQVLLLNGDDFEVPDWERNQLLSEQRKWEGYHLSITDSEARRIT